MATPSTLEQAALWAQVIFYSVTAVSILTAGVAGAIRYRLFRAGRPFITISLEVSSRPCSATQVQIGAAARLHNGSRVLAEAETLEWECRALATYMPQEIDEKIAEYFPSPGNHIKIEPGNSEFPWNLQQRITKTNLNIGIEPNEYSHDNVTFIVPKYCTAVQIRLFIPIKDDGQKGWTAVVYHDVRP